MLTFSQLSDKFLAWSANHRDTRTTEWYSNYLKMFVAYPGIAETPADQLKPWQVQEWVDSHGDAWGSTYRGGAVTAIKRVYHWADELGHMETNPVKKLKKSQAQRRKTYMKPEDFGMFLAHLGSADPFRDILIFAWNTGARPQEIRHIEHRHINLEKGYILFPKEESKGKRVPRKILLNDIALEIIKRLMNKNADGKVFRNSRNEAWTKFALCNRMQRLSDVTGKKMCMYDCRHGYATRKIKAKHGHLEIAATMGHTDGSMLAKVYSHIDEDDEHLRTVLID
jgi:integrase